MGKGENMKKVYRTVRHKKEMAERLRKLKFFERQTYDDVIHELMMACMMEGLGKSELDLDALREWLWFRKKG